MAVIVRERVCVLPRSHRRDVADYALISAAVVLLFARPLSHSSDAVRGDILHKECT